MDIFKKFLSFFNDVSPYLETNSISFTPSAQQKKEYDNITQVDIIDGSLILETAEGITTFLKPKFLEHFDELVGIDLLVHLHSRKIELGLSFRGGLIVFDGELSLDNFKLGEVTNLNKLFS